MKFNVVSFVTICPCGCKEATLHRCPVGFVLTQDSKTQTINIRHTGIKGWWRNLRDWMHTDTCTLGHLIEIVLDIHKDGTGRQMEFTSPIPYKLLPFTGMHTSRVYPWIDLATVNWTA